MSTICNSILTKIKVLIWVLLFIVVETGCKKFVEIDAPTDRITEQNIFLNDKSAISVLNSIYSDMQPVCADLSEFAGLLADEWGLWSDADQERIALYTNSLVSAEANNPGSRLWNSNFNFIFRCNAIIEGVDGNVNLSKGVRTQLLGEALFLRAFLNFYLLNLYGAIPLVKTSDPEIVRSLPQSSLVDVYNFIEGDLIKAKDLLSISFLDGRLQAYAAGAEQRVRPTKWAASALLARKYLQNGEWRKAELESTFLIDNSNLFSLVPLDDVFLKNNSESIWQLQPTIVGWNTYEGRRFNLQAFPAGFNAERMVYLSSFILNSFETGDQRKTQWVDSLIEGSLIYKFPSKYRKGEFEENVASIEGISEYTVVLRMAEQYLIRAEARARLNDLSAAISDLDKIRSRASLNLINDLNPQISQPELLDVVLHERQVELFTEWGHRWFDLARYGKLNQVMSVITPIKGGEWQKTDCLLPIPFDDLLFNSKLIQNEGY